MRQASVTGKGWSINLGAISLAAIFAIAPNPSYATEIIGSSGDWEIFRDSKSCGMTRTYEVPGETEMMVIKYAAGEIRILITNKGWSAKQDQLYDISYQLNGGTYGGAKAVGTADRDRRGFVSTFVTDFGGDLAKGSIMRVFLSGKEIERLPLTGTGAAMAQVDQCLADVRATLAAAKRESDKRAKLPKDPFATSSKDRDR